ncbi:MAG: hypothetical protein MUC92_00145 [Fimbriimonadaceae bacterium]|jgi:hypothetical protein|nr:hypothetical protein [Fimbriimonadaceae bacterium]
MIGFEAPLNTRLKEIWEDMTLPHVAPPSGLPSQVDWRLKPRPGMMNDPGTWQALTAWGQVYLADGTAMPSNTRIQVADVQAWMLNKKTSKWIMVQHSEVPSGAFYREDFAEDKNVPSDAKPEKGGGVSIQLKKGYNYHFWPTGDRYVFKKEEIGGWYFTVRTRLIVADPSQPDDRSKAKVMMGVGADYWSTPTAGWDNFKTNADLAIGRLRWITNNWTWHHMTTITRDELAKNPPPMPKQTK